VLAVTLHRVRLNRAWAFSGTSIVDNAMEVEYATARKGVDIDNKWMLDTTTGTAPVTELGAYLYIGDGHAAQGAGELTGDAMSRRGCPSLRWRDSPSAADDSAVRYGGDTAGAPAVIARRSRSICRSLSAK
jgi:hypothetical protein